MHRLFPEYSAKMLKYFSERKEIECALERKKKESEGGEPRSIKGMNGGD